MTGLRRILLSGLLAWVMAAILGTAAEARFFSIEALEPGMRGTAKTVVRGTEIETFEVEFLGVLPQAGPSGDLLLIRVSGDVIDRTGGIAAGMSGSPVYIGDQLVGAIGYAYDFADHRIGMVTPIGDMLAVMELMDPGNRPDASSVQEARGQKPASGDGVPRAAVLAHSWAEAKELAAALPDDVRVFVPVQTPVLASGFSSRALSRLQQRLAPLSLVPLQAGGAAVAVEHVHLEPGSAVGAQLMRGDVSLTAIGTVTYIDNDRFVAFGHPFTNLGSVDFLTTGAYVHYVVQSVSIPFKIGSPTVPIGAIRQDRGAAIAGELGPLPYMVPVSVTVHDRDRGISRTLEFGVVHDDRLLVELAVAGALSALDRSLDRLGPGTSRVVFQIRGEGMPRPLVRDNMWYSASDVAAVSLLEFLEAVDLVVNNRFTPVTISRIQVVAEVEEHRWTARIEEATPSSTEVIPGESVRVTVRLRPFRGEAMTEELILTVPKDASPGPVTVVVRGGGWGEESALDEDQEDVDDSEELLGENVQDFDRLIEEFVRRERNNEVVVEFYSSRETRSEEAGNGDDEDDDGDDGMPREESEEDGVHDDRHYGWTGAYEPPERVVASVPTDYFILGSTSFELLIVPDYRTAGAEESTEEPAPDQDLGEEPSPTGVEQPAEDEPAEGPETGSQDGADDEDVFAEPEPEVGGAGEDESEPET